MLKKYSLIILLSSIGSTIIHSHSYAFSLSDAKTYLSQALDNIAKNYVLPGLQVKSKSKKDLTKKEIHTLIQDAANQLILESTEKLIPPAPPKPSYPIEKPLDYIQKTIDQAHLDPTAKKTLKDLSAQQLVADKTYTNLELQKIMTDAITQFKNQGSTSQATYTQTDAWLRNPGNYERYVTWFMGGKKRLNDKIKPLSSIDKKSPLYKSYNKIRGSVYNYYDIVQECLRNEARYLKSHYVFYTAHDYRLRVAYDLTTALYQREYNTPTPNYIFLRSYKVDRYENLPALNDWMDNIVQKYGEISDYGPETAGFLLSTNLSLFGEIGRPNSNTWKYFIKSQSANPPPMGLILDETLKAFIVNPAQRMHIVYVLMRLTETIDTPEGNLLQIFIPIEKVDESAYLSKPRAKIWDTKIVDTKKNVWSEEKKRYLKISPVLDLYRNKPDEFGSNMDKLEARIIPRKEYFAYPNSGVKFFRFTTLDSTREKIYEKRLNIIADFIYDQYLKDKSEANL